eukprot:CAMPEP_0194288354 /NCGR_PEP_ID=MMETSP0169-20130528/36610_1 /TAXON_ID=218684 /ORGANISM="Corethron pennatum, Strain L29A3" /LENGTH=271 /DNA_ID=CAMNT_0039035325 /DNA_START=134 /DNA_END=949 /DNA_ORIENTATION=-
MSNDSQKRDPENQKEDWRAFGGEVGRLLSRLYGGDNANRPKVSYPALKTSAKAKKELDTRAEWKAVNNKFGAEDPRQKRYDAEKARSLAVPAVGRRRSGPTPHRRPLRKDGRTCLREIAEADLKASAYRPPEAGLVCTDADKARLVEIFTFRGGRALPEEMTGYDAGTTPSQMAEARKRTLVTKIGDKHSKKTVDRVKGPTGKKLSAKDELFDHIVEEIEERRRFQREMIQISAGSAKVDPIAKEISARIIRLQHLNPGRTSSLLNSWYRT